MAAWGFRNNISIILVVITLLITSCGGGSNSGSGSQTSVSFNVGTYVGVFTLLISNNEFSSDPTTGNLRLEVSGSEGSQLVFVEFTQFSTTAAIGDNGEFELNSGQFSLGIVDPDTGDTNAVCMGSLSFIGLFVDTVAAGNVTGEFTCPFLNDPLTAEGAFEVTFESGLQKAVVNDLDYIFNLH